ncbi:Iron transport multicopper oxidase [Aspergillus sclerotialis]|uniref:Iron transport multicopper oxidase n=1 Tax=Aspergillus sclerotialis TaxID=2070753 RepID=A0A3A2Z772_9EURO|nr:Iron transport multicopper oxidase [Aspergillus sclerotialis]
MAPWFLLAAFFAYLPVINGATIDYDWDITWVTANPDGAKDRPVIGINGQWPLPVLNFTKGDRVVANVHNSLKNQSTSIHWHGLFQNGTTHMDGSPMSTQCEIPPGATLTYNFTIDQTGTYWYHSHTRGQYPNGIRQALIVSDPKNPYAGHYEEERVITLSDWYHDQMPMLLEQFVSVTNPTGAEPVPDAALMNDTQNLAVAVEPGKTYLFRLVNVAAFASQYFWIEGHTMKIVEVDGVWTDAAETDMIYITAAQRYSILVTMKDEAKKNYAMVGSMDTNYTDEPETLFDKLPPSLDYNVTGWLVYNNSAIRPTPAVVDEFKPYDDFNLAPADGRKLYGAADHTVQLDLTMDNLGDGAN